MNIWGLKKKIQETRYSLKEAVKQGDRIQAERCKGSIVSLKRQIEKIRRERKNGKRK